MEFYLTNKTSRVAGSNTLHFAPRLDYSSLDTWLSALSTDCSVFCTECPALAADIAASNTLRLVLCPDISGLHTLRSHRSRIAPRSTLDAPRFARIAPRSAPCVPC